jgi:hypothetical protein
MVAIPRAGFDLVMMSQPRQGGNLDVAAAIVGRLSE